MTRNQVTFVLGLLLLFIPLSGFPYLWKNTFYIAAGIILLAMAVLSYIKYSHVFDARDEREEPARELPRTDGIIHSHHIATDSNESSRL